MYYVLTCGKSEWLRIVLTLNVFTENCDFTSLYPDKSPHLAKYFAVSSFRVRGAKIVRSKHAIRSVSLKIDHSNEAAHMSVVYSYQY